jgi:hypothetical protein
MNKPRTPRLEPTLASITGPLALVVLLLAGAPDAAVGQSGVSVEPRVGVTFPLGDLSDAGAESGVLMGGDLFLSFHPSFSGYLSLNRHSFACGDDCELGGSPRSVGLGAGIKYFVPSPADALVWARGGIVGHQYEDDQVSGDRGVGFELGAGIDMLIGARLYLVPHLGFLLHDAARGMTASYLTFGVGLHYHIR